jgi:putative tryptophan/tyrosine transport system substrate-binding protein
VKAGAAVLILALGLLAAPLAAEAQPAGKVYRLGYLSMVPPPDDTRVDSFREALRDLGYLEGRNIVLEIRHAEGKPERLPDLAADLVRRKVDLIVTATGAAAVAAKEATQTIPIVMLGSGDVVRQGLVASLARPGGNVTGLTMISPELSRKRLELLREMLPKLSHVGVLWCGPGFPAPEQEWVETQAAADILGVRLSSLEARGRDDLARAFASAAKQRVQAVLGLDCPSLSPSAALLAELSLKHRLPAMYPFALYPRAGSLISYGASLVAAPRHAATYVDKILRGAKPGELPIEQTPEVELVINLKTAKALGLTIPPSLLLRADQVIE